MHGCALFFVATVTLMLSVGPPPCSSSVYMRQQEECIEDGSSGSARCIKTKVFDPPPMASYRRNSVQGIEEPVASITNVSKNYTPLPFAAFLKPMHVSQAAEETVFNVLDEEGNLDRLLKGGKRQKDREVKSEDESTLSESENTSNSNVKFRRRKGGKRSDRKRRLRRERIERKRTRRKNKRKNRKERKNKNKHPKQRKGKKRKLKRGKLRSLKTKQRNRNRKEQIGINPTIFIEGAQNDASVAELLKSDVRMATRDSVAPPETHVFDSEHLLIPQTNGHGLNSLSSANHGDSLKSFISSRSSDLTNSFTSTNNGNSPSSLFLPPLGDLTKSISGNIGNSLAPSIGTTRSDDSFFDYNSANNLRSATGLEDYSSEEDLTDLEYFHQQDEDYQLESDYFSWKDNASIDYFTQGEDTTVSPESQRSSTALDSLKLDPSNIQIRRHLVRLHNLFRSKVEPPASNMLALSWHGAAASQARQWAESCVAHRGRDHASVRWTPRYGACGQNVLVTRRKKRWGQVIRTWWSERRHFQYGSNDLRNNTYKARSYTQMVWYSSHKVGCGYSQCTTTSGTTFHRYVCNYCPAGNDPSRLSLPYSRGRPCEMCPKACRAVCPEGQCRLCTNRCPFSDLWANCDTLAQRWRRWLCNTKTQLGVERFKNCRATCQCALMGDKII